jgi:uncharacterized protein (TIGR02246 family)
MSVEAEVQRLYDTLIDAWNRRDAAAMAWTFAEDGSQVGFDGSQINGQKNIEAHLTPIFASHPTPAFVTVTREVRSLGNGTVILRADAGMIQQGKTEINPALNAVQSMVAVRRDGRWQVALFQNTPAAFHGRPQDVERFTADLRGAALKR